ncbi:hypothetical protein SUSAZ_00830 [Sulfolobus acidocaldarius SUSAZ]|nr:hypothetical protein SUSAZ_00830 [Sulfolobus acidocaldarius SUSAZ]
MMKASPFKAERKSEFTFIFNSANKLVALET